MSQIGDLFMTRGKDDKLGVTCPPGRVQMGSKTGRDRSRQGWTEAQINRCLSSIQSCLGVSLLWLRRPHSPGTIDLTPSVPFLRRFSWKLLKAKMSSELPNPFHPQLPLRFKMPLE